VNLVGSGLFTGHIPFASGTFGSLLAFGIYLIPGFSQFLPLTFFTIVFFTIGIYLSEIMRKRYGDDPPEVVIDEIVGQWFTYLIGSIVFELFFPVKTFDPAFSMSSKIAFGIIGFLFFRFFDIIKLEPAKYFDEKPSGFGIMMDDIAAGLYAGIFTSVATHLIWYRLIVKLHV
jgi:phosphatidylglycerophosphatase A